MRWARGYRSDNVELRGRSAGGGLGHFAMLLPFVSRFGVWGILALGALYIAGRALGGESAMFGAGERAPSRASYDDEAVQFVSFVLDDTQNTWRELFEKRGLAYRDAHLIVFDEATSTGCGFGSAAAGPFYCPIDSNVYIDLSFYRQLRSRFGAPGDFAQAYVIAHEIGHHVQQQLGLLAPSRGSGPNSRSVFTELQADCFAGVWAHSTARRELLERGDIDEALGAAAAIGDDAIQRQAEGVVRPERWTHGSSEQRVAWYRRGYNSGSADTCTEVH